MRDMTLDNFGVVAIYSDVMALGGSIPMDENVPAGWTRQGTAHASAAHAAAIHLPADRVGAIRGAGLEHLEIVNCSTFDQIVRLLAERKVSVCIVDVSLADCWPTYAADRVIEASHSSAAIVFVCTGPERDAFDIITRCRNVPNAHVVMAARLSSDDIVTICNAFALISRATPDCKLD